MYSEKLKKLMKKNKIEVGDGISVKTKAATYSGILMPRAQGREDILVLKLASGYNIGISIKDTELKLLKKGVPPKPKPERNEPKKGDVAILGCGGTIASRIEYTTGAVFPAITAAELRAAFPKLEELNRIHSKKVFSLLSEDMNVHHWRLLADAITKEIKGGAKGVVVMHGTDTIGYTSAAMSFAFQNLPVPVILVGAQRSSDRPSSENEMNMSNAMYSALQDVGEVGLCMHASTNDDFCHLHHGTKVRKMHTSRRDAFRSINTLPIAEVDYSREMFRELSPYRKRSQPEKLEVKKKFSENVGMLYMHPGIKPELFKSMRKYDGLVLVGTGIGHAPTNAFDDRHARSTVPEIKSLVDSGIPVVMSSQTIYGRICMRVYTAGRLLMDAGVIGDDMDWTPEAAYAKLCWVMGQTKSVKKATELMLTDIAGEIGARTPLEGYP